ncbi:MAG: phosphatase PAP2 family protein [Gammaproteobacteria bacterium]|nr:phosphatase PAP2 family protein [Gammaproteobacteria bacterium]
MSIVTESILIKRASDFESAVCININRLCQRFYLNSFFKVISRLGDGIIWYALTLLLPVVMGRTAIYVSIKMTVSALIGLAIYKIIKHQTERPRPYTVIHNLVLGTSPLDKYSFPSGHTLHAVSFSYIAIFYYPELFWPLVPLAALIAISRITLGLHYPTDVIAGAGIGYVSARTITSVL